MDKVIRQLEDSLDNEYAKARTIALQFAQLGQPGSDTVTTEYSKAADRATTAYNEFLRGTVDYLDSSQPSGRTSPSIRDAKQVLQWLDKPHTYFGRLYIAVRDSRGKRRRNEAVRRGQVRMDQSGRRWAAGDGE
ncbi:hypothetical protein [Amycolatopsis echigonensis]|nr:hypothetical protein [Amycolatopsis echigonensis]